MLANRSLIPALALLSLGCASRPEPQTAQSTRDAAIPGVALATEGAPRVFAMRGDALAVARAAVRRGDAGARPAYEKLLEDADKELVAPIVAVTDKKTLLPPSNDPHDYFSLSPYWWPDPNKADGLPYIRRDGETNPESKRDLDQPRVARMGQNVHTLGLAYYFSGDRKYADRAARQIRAWFLDAETRMNPHLRFAQLVRGNPNERGSGIIDTRWFIEAVDAAGLIAQSKHWTAADQQRLQEWFRAYLTWLQTSPNGEHERVAVNNHGSWFAAQTGSYALFVGDTAAARAIVSAARARIGSQITTQGTQPIELERTRSMHYASFNVEALSRVAEMGRWVGIDLWRHQAPEGGSLIRAIDHLAPYIGEPRTKWPGQQIDDVELPPLVLHLRRASYALGEPRYAPVLNRLAVDVVRSDRSALLYPDVR